MRSARLRLAALALLIGGIASLPPARRTEPESSRRDHRGRIPAALGFEDEADAQAEMEFQMLRDPRANSIPRGIRRREASFARALPVRTVQLYPDGPGGGAVAQSLVWTERG